MADLVDGLFPAGRIHLIGGAAGAGKTTLLAWMLKRIRAGEELFGRVTHPPAGIYYLTADQQWREYESILGKAGLVLDGHYSFGDDPEMSYLKFSAKEPIPLLRKAMLGLHPVPGSIVVVDIFGIFLGDDMRQYRQILSRMWEYNRWVDELGITLFGSVHAGKQKAGSQERYVRLFDRVMGGGPMRAAASTACYLTSEEEAGDEGYQIFEINPRLGKREAHKVAFGMDGLLVPIAEAVETIPQRAQQVLNLVPEDGIQASVLIHTAEGMGISRATLYRALEQLKQSGLVAKDESHYNGLWARRRTN